MHAYPQTVVGTDREVALALSDKTGAVLKDVTGKTTSNSLEFVVSSDGQHTIQVRSNRIGAYTVHVTVEEAETEESIQAKIDDLRRQLAVEEQKLKDLKEKKKQQ